MLSAVWLYLVVASAPQLTPEAATEVRRAEADLATATHLLARSRDDAEVVLAKQLMHLAAQRRRLAIDSCASVEAPAKLDPYASDPWDPVALDEAAAEAWRSTEAVAKKVTIRLGP